MAAKRKCRKEKLSKQPLALVLIQLRLTPVANIEEYIGQIQNFLRQSKFPSVKVGNSVSISVGPKGISQPLNHKQWLFLSADEHSNIVVDEKQITFQISNYTDFENCTKIYYDCLNQIMKITGQDENGYIKSFGLRYVDQIIPQDDSESIDSYLQEAVKLGCPKVFNKDSYSSTANVSGVVDVAPDVSASLSIRTTQGANTFELPPDLLQNAPKLVADTKSKKIGMIDMDCNCKPNGIMQYNFEKIDAIFYKMHDIIIETFFEDVVSKEGVEKWR